MARVGFLRVVAAALLAFAGTDAVAAEFKNGTSFGIGTVPSELVVERRPGEPVQFLLEENASTGFKWEFTSNTNECTVALAYRKSGKGNRITCGAASTLEVTVTSRVSTPVRVEFRYRRPWEKDTPPWKTLRLEVVPGA